MSDTSIGPENPPPAKDVKTQPTVEGVDAQNANEFDMQHGLAGAQAKTTDEGSNKPAGDTDKRTSQGLNHKPSESPFGYSR